MQFSLPLWIFYVLSTIRLFNFALAAGSIGKSLYAKSLYIQELDTAAFDSPSNSHTIKLSTGPYNGAHIITFYAPWCPHCVHFVPVYNEVASYAHESLGLSTSVVRFFAVDCVKYSQICNSMQVKGYPTIKAFNFPGGNSQL